MAFEEELVNLLGAATTPLTFGTDLFFGSGAEIPSVETPLVSVIITAGPPEIRFQTGSYVRPGAQITCRAKEYTDARDMAYNVYRALAGVRNRTVAGTWYREIYPVQEPFDNGLDDQDRVQFVFNIVAVKNPS